MMRCCTVSLTVAFSSFRLHPQQPRYLDQVQDRCGNRSKSPRKHQGCVCFSVNSAPRTYLTNKSLELCKEGSKIVEICQKGDQMFEEELAKVYKGKKIPKGMSFAL